MSKRLAEWDQIRELAFYGLPCSAISQKSKIGCKQSKSVCHPNAEGRDTSQRQRKTKIHLRKKKSIISSYQSTGIKRGCLGSNHRELDRGSNPLAI